MKRVYGWKPDLPDHRDLHFTQTVTLLPVKVDLREQDTPIYDQGQLGSCTANAIAGHLDFNRKKQGEHPIHPSRLFIYYNERLLENSVEYDSGATIRESVKVVRHEGACPEKHWPYDIAKFTLQPTKEVYAEALSYADLTYLRVANNLHQLKTCISEGYPFVFGFTVYESFESPAVAKTGKMVMPSTSEQVLGGHAVMAVGYDDHLKCFIVRNSWGSHWGDKGYFYMPYEYITNPHLASDFWTLRAVA